MEPDDLEQAWRAYREHGDQVALDLLVRQYARLAGYLAQRALVKAPEHQDPEEIISFAQDGLLDALRKFDPAQGVKFETYATRRIAGEIVDGLRRKDPLGRMQRRQVKIVDAAVHELVAELHRHPTSEELSERTGMSTDDVRLTLLAQKTTNDHLDDNPAHEGRFASTSDAETESQLAEIRWTVAHRLALMSGQERAFVLAHYCDDLNIKTTSAALGISTKRCRATRADVWRHVAGRSLRGMAQSVILDG